MKECEQILMEKIQSVAKFTKQGSYLYLSFSGCCVFSFLFSVGETSCFYFYIYIYIYIYIANPQSQKPLKRGVINLR